MDTDIIKISDVVREGYAEFAREREPAKRGRISPSKISKGCLLSVYYDLTEETFVAEERDYANVLTLEYGKFIHARLQEFFAQHYASIGWTYLPEQDVTISEHCFGKMDALVMDPEGRLYMDEYKSCSDNVYENLGKKPHEDYVDQMQLYYNGVEVVHGRLLYLNRNNFKMKEFQVTPNEARKAELKALVLEVEDAAVKRIPPMPTEHWMGTSPCTKTCVYRNMCPVNVRNSSRRI